MKTDTFNHRLNWIKNDKKRISVLIGLPIIFILIFHLSVNPSSISMSTQLIQGLLWGLVLLVLSFIFQILFWGKPDYLPNFKATLLFSTYIFLVNAFAEELFFRGLIQRFLMTIFPNSFLPLLVTALIFGFYHMPLFKWKIWQALVAVLAGLIFGYAYQVTNSLIVVWFMHGFTDLGFTSETFGGYLLWGIIKRKELEKIPKK